MLTNKTLREFGICTSVLTTILDREAPFPQQMEDWSWGELL